MNYDEEDDEMLLWDAGGDSVSRLHNVTIQELTVSTRNQ
jgi:hypothetical protein